MKKLSDLDYKYRHDYQKGKLSKQDVASDPLDQFQTWFEDFSEADPHQPNAMVLTTVSESGIPSSRIVLLMKMDQDGFVFFTNYHSQKGKDIDYSPEVSLLFYSAVLERQIRIQGSVEKTSRKESEDYFKTRSLKSQVSAVISNQSEHVDSRDILESHFNDLLEASDGKPIECPLHWGGYRVKPRYFEFWQGRLSRLHDRITYTLTDTTWVINRTAP